MYPMKLKPAFKDYLWGGERLATAYGKPTSMRPLAESWEISCHPDGLSIIDNGAYAGKSLADVVMEHPDYIGTSYNPQKGFPILVKLIDAKQSLSLQVHPSDEDTLRMEGRREGKNEMWYVLDVLPGAKMVMGFRHPVGEEEIRRRIRDNTIMEIVREVPVKPGDCFPIPAGMLHAIGAGILLAEVQQSSNMTYRMYDFDRRDKDGNPRELHIDKATEVIDVSLEVQNTGGRTPQQYDGYYIRELLFWQWFRTSLLEVQISANLQCRPESFIALLCVEGAVALTANSTAISLRSGESAFLPAGLGDYFIKGTGKLLLVTVPHSYS